MTANQNKARWELLQVNTKDESFTVQDNLLNKKRAYHVPHLLHATLVEQTVYIFTTNSKVMRLSLQNATRQFLSPTQLASLKQIQKTHIGLHAKKNLVPKKSKFSLSNIVKLPKHAFSNTLSAFSNTVKTFTNTINALE